MRLIGLSGSSVGYRNCERRIGAEEGTGERGQGEAGEEELSPGLPAAEQPLHLPLVRESEEQAAAAASARGRREEDEQCTEPASGSVWFSVVFTSH